MDARRSRNGSAQRLAEFRWWGSVLLAMFALVQTARGAAGSPNAAADPTGGYSISPCVSAEAACSDHAPQLALHSSTPVRP